MHVFVISPFPRRDTPESGISYYARTLARQLKIAGLEVTAVGQKDAYADSADVEIARVWDISALFPFQIARALFSKGPGTALVHHALFLYGTSMLNVLVFPLLLLLLRASRCRVITELHDLRPLSTIDKAFVKDKGIPIPPLLVRTAYRALFFLIGLLSHRIIVHDAASQCTAIEDYRISSAKISRVALVLPTSEPMDREAARSQLDLNSTQFCFLFFGYASDYKGLDVLADVVKRISSDPDAANIRLEIAAGPNPHLASQPEYQAYYAATRASLEKFSCVRWHGFVPDDRVALYFSAADAVILPYTKTIGSSAPLTQALSYGLPVVVSNHIPTEGYDGDLIICEPTSNSLENAMREVARQKRAFRNDLSAVASVQRRLILEYVDAIRAEAMPRRMA